ncbi:MAG: CBS domain-containing protein, partial [Candidatus Helarchaeales archaeon]
REIMTTDVVTVKSDCHVYDMLNKIEKERHMGYPVVNEKNELEGIIAFEDVRKVILNGNHELRAKDFCRHELITAFEDETIHDVMMKMIKYDIGRVPVVSRENPKLLKGIITRSDIIKAHELASMKLKVKKDR